MTFEIELTTELDEVEFYAIFKWGLALQANIIVIF